MVFISREEYEELHEGFTARRRKSEDEIMHINSRMKEVLSDNTEKYKWISYFTEHENIETLTRAVAVELIRQVRVIDKKNIEVIFNFDDAFRSYSHLLDPAEVQDGRVLVMPPEKRVERQDEKRSVISNVSPKEQDPAVQMPWRGR